MLSRSWRPGIPWYEEGKEAIKDKTVYQKSTLFDRFGYETENTLFKNGEEYLNSNISSALTANRWK